MSTLAKSQARADLAAANAGLRAAIFHRAELRTRIQMKKMLKRKEVSGINGLRTWLRTKLAGKLGETHKSMMEKETKKRVEETEKRWNDIIETSEKELKQLDGMIAKLEGDKKRATAAKKTAYRKKKK